MTAKNPNYVNQTGFDAGVVFANGVLSSGSTSTTVRTVGENTSVSNASYEPQVFTLAIDLSDPGVKIVKLVNAQDADIPTGPHVAAGSTVTFSYVVTNTGNVPLANVVVNDDKLGPITSFTGDTNNNGLLDLTETWTYTRPPPPWPASRPTSAPSPPRTPTTRPARRSATTTRPTTSATPRRSTSSSSSTARTPTSRPGRTWRPAVR